MKNPSPDPQDRKKMTEKAIEILCSLDHDYPGNRKVEWIYNILLELKRLEK